MKKSFNYVVIGGGSAGCVVASRLSERPDVTVLLLEAGGRDRSLLLQMPLAFRLLRNTMKFDWGYASDPEPHAQNRSIPAARGRVLGGSSSVNGMMYSRGHPDDYDDWARLGAKGWSFDEVLPFFKRSENNWRGASKWHGSEGPMSVTRMSDSDPLTKAMVDTARRMNHNVTEDFDGGVADGFGLPDLTTHHGRRASASKAFLSPARHRRNLTVVTSAQVTRILVDSGRATGVEYQSQGTSHKVFAESEIILSGGAYASPQILMLSGIGGADHLRQNGVKVVVDLPGVGRNLQDHPLVPMGFRAKRPFDFGAKLRADRLALAVAHWMLTGKGFPATQPLTSIAYYKSLPELPRPDLESIFMSTSLNARVWFPGFRTRSADILTSLNVALRPKSRGSVELRSANPLESPRIRFNLLAEPDDMNLLRHTIKWTRILLRESPIANHVGAEAFPGSGVESDPEIDAYIRSSVVTAQHPASTCRMGEDNDAVVDSRLRVHGIQGLRVADASVMPVLISGHTNAPSIMIGEKVAQMLFDDA